MTNLQVIDRIISALPSLAEPREKTVTFRMEHPPFRSLYQFLERLPREQMLAVITAMYFGRDDCVSVLSIQEHCSRTFSDSGDMAWQLLDKAPVLERYFARARKRAWMDGIDLNHLPLTPATLERG